MKKASCALLAALLLVSLAACQREGGGFVVVASTYPMYCAVLNLTRGADGVTVRALSNFNAGCAHDYQLTSADRRALADASLVVMNGAGLEPYLDAVLPTLRAVVNSTDGMELISSTDAHTSKNPHTWVSIPRMITQTRNIKDALVSADARNAAIYGKNYNDFAAKLEAVYGKLKAAVAPFAGARVVTFHPAFDYLALDLGLTVVGSLVIEPETPPTARELRELINVITLSGENKSGVKAMFVEVGETPDSAAAIARDTGVPLYALDPAAIPVEGVADMDRYVYAMEYNLLTLPDALSDTP